MIKNVLKVLYVAFGAVLAFIVYLMGYNTNGYNHIKKMTTTAINNKDYVEVAMIHGGCFEKTNLVTDNSDELDLAIFPSTTLTTVGYYEEGDKTKTVNSYDNSYYIYIFNPIYDMRNVNTTGKMVNSTGIRFISDNGSYDYVFDISDTLNSDRYVSKPGNKNEALLNGSRNLTTSYTNWGFLSVTLTDSLISAMSSQLNGAIRGLEVLDSSGKTVYSVDINLDFSQQFFKDVNDLVVNYNVYINEVASEDKEVSKAAEEKFNKFYLGDGENKGFEESFKAHENYTFRHPDKYLQPSKLIWQTIGILVIYLICCVLLYMLFFHFKFLKRLITREGTHEYRVNPGANRKNVIDAKVSEKKENKKEIVEKKEAPQAEVIEEKQEPAEVVEEKPEATEESTEEVKENKGENVEE